MKLLVINLERVYPLTWMASEWKYIPGKETEWNEEWKNKKRWKLGISVVVCGSDSKMAAMHELHFVDWGLRERPVANWYVPINYHVISRGPCCGTITRGHDKSFAKLFIFIHSFAFFIFPFFFLNLYMQEKKKDLIYNCTYSDT